MGRKKEKSFLDVFNNEWHNILFLYLLHHQEDYAYNIAREFKGANKDRKGILEKSRRGSLMDPSKVSVYLNEMEEDGLLTSEEKVVKRKERRYYQITPAAFSTRLRDELFGKDEYLKLTTKAKRDIERSIRHVGDFIEYIQNFSPSQGACAKKIMSLGKYDALTVLTYFSGLVSEIHEFIADVFNMPPPMTIFKSLRSAETRQIMEKLMELLVNPEFSALSKFFDIFVKLSDALKLVGPPDTFELPDGSFDVELFEKSLYDTLHSGKFERSNEDYQLTPPWALTFAKEVYEIKYFFPKIYPKLEEDRKARVKNSFLNVKKPEKISKKEKRKLFSMYLSDYSSFLDDCIRFYLYKERGLRYIPPSSHLIAEFF